MQETQSIFTPTTIIAMALSIILGFVIAHVVLRRLGIVTGLLQTRAYSGRGTIDRLAPRGLALCVLGIVLFVLGVGLSALLPEEFAEWVELLTGPIMVIGSFALGLGSGMTTVASTLLNSPQRRDGLLRAIELKERTRRALGRFLTLMLVLLAPGGAHDVAASEATWAVGIDVSASVSSTDRAAAIELLIPTIVHTAQPSGAQQVMVIKFAHEGLFSPTTWIGVPVEPRPVDCTLAKPERKARKGLGSISPAVRRAEKRAAVEACEQKQAGRLLQYERQRRSFEANLREATSVVPRKDVQTHLVPFLREVVTVPDVVRVTVISDGFDESSEPVAFEIPAGVDTLLILTRPDTELRAFTIERAQEWARRWRAVPNLDVATVGQLPGVWQPSSAE